MLRQVGYLSTATREIGFPEIAALIRAAHKRNALTGLSGILIYGGTLFFQTLEGPRDHVEAALQRIQRDARHYGLKILFDEHVEDRSFAEWPMAYQPLDEGVARDILAGRIADEALVPALVSGLSQPVSRAILMRLSAA